MKIYGVYEDDEYQECRFVGSAREIAKEFGCDKTAVIHAVERKSKLQWKYLILELYKEGTNERI